MKIPVVEQIMAGNDEIAAEIRAKLDAHNVLSLNIMASPGAGKTSLIEQTLGRMAGVVRIGMINGDISTSLDAERGQRAGAIAVQINTGGNCHLEAHMLRGALAQLDLNAIDLLLVENVGNLVCPSGWKLGTHYSVLVSSTPEGDDKPYKYPGMFRGVDLLLVNKMDLMPHLNFDLARFRAGVEILNPGLTTFPISCTTGEGLDEWITWLNHALSHQA